MEGHQYQPLVSTLGITSPSRFSSHHHLIMPLCDHCGDTVLDVLSHHLTRHPDEPISARVVREALEAQPNIRCNICYIPVANLPAHIVTQHSVGSLLYLARATVRVDSDECKPPWIRVGTNAQPLTRLSVRRIFERET